MRVSPHRCSIVRLVQPGERVARSRLRERLFYDGFEILEESVSGSGEGLSLDAARFALSARPQRSLTGSGAVAGVAAGSGAVAGVAAGSGVCSAPWRAWDTRLRSVWADMFVMVSWLISG